MTPSGVSVAIGRAPLPEGKLLGEGAGALGSCEDRRVWTVNAFGLRLYAAAGCCVQIEYGSTRGLVQVDNGDSQHFLRAYEAARRYARRRTPTAPWTEERRR